MMRAYLSVPECSGARVLLSGFPPNRELEAQAAESEARRILADVELKGEPIGQWSSAWYDRMVIHPCDARERKELRDSIAESLTAFLAALDPAAWLKERQ